jgi:hypothetical protein
MGFAKFGWSKRLEDIRSRQLALWLRSPPLGLLPCRPKPEATDLEKQQTQSDEEAFGIVQQGGR